MTSLNQVVDQGPIPERCNSFIPGINLPYLVIYPWDKAHLSLELSYYTFQEAGPAVFIETMVCCSFLQAKKN